jgi:hypothetical protein
LHSAGINAIVAVPCGGSNESGSSMEDDHTLAVD